MFYWDWSGNWLHVAYSHFYECDGDETLCLLLMDDHKVDDLHVLCIKLKNLTELVQRILELWRIFASIYSDFEKACLCSHVNQFALRGGCVGRRQSGHSFLKSSSPSMVLLGAICSNMSGTGKSEMSSFVFLYIVLAAINKTKGHLSSEMCEFS